MRNPKRYMLLQVSLLAVLYTFVQATPIINRRTTIATKSNVETIGHYESISSNILTPLKGVRIDDELSAGRLKRSAAQDFGHTEDTSLRENLDLHHQNRQRKHPSHIRRGSQPKPSASGKRACNTKRVYLALTEAVDVHGDVVQIAPLTGIDGQTIRQFFHQSFCDVENCQCRGIDADIYESACQTQYKLTYATVIKNNTVGLSRIKVPSGCGCVVKERREYLQTNILELI